LPPILDVLGIYCAAIFVCAAWSMFLYKDNPFYRFAEATCIAVSLGYLLVFSMKYVYDLTLSPISKGNFLGIFVFALGLLVYLRLLPQKPNYLKYKRLANWGVAIVVGVGIGLTIRGEAELNVRGILLGLVGTPLIGGTITPADNLVGLIMTTSIIAYFIFSRKQEGKWGWVMKLGRYMMMWVFGVEFANQALSRFSEMISSIIQVLRALGLA